jgi:hypothetical protein
LLGMVPSLSTSLVHYVFTLSYWFVSTYFATCSYQSSLSNFIPISLHVLKCSWTHTLSYLFIYRSFASIRHADVMLFIFSSNCWRSLHLLSVCSISIARYFIVSTWSCAVFRSIWFCVFVMLDLLLFFCNALSCAVFNSWLCVVFLMLGRVLLL